MNCISLFSGIEAASVAWGQLGWSPVAFAEIEPFCCDLLEKRFPDVPNLGDVSGVGWEEYEGSIDVVVGGSPCQAFSVAGRRRGLMDERGRLMLEFVRCVREAKPRWVVWENVPGVLSQDGGRAFGALLGELEDCGYALSWRVLDAQFFGVPQRRRRVFLVGHPVPGCSAGVLFEPHCLRGDHPSSREKRQELAARAGSGAQGEGGCIAFSAGQSAKAGSAGARHEVSPTLRGSASGTNQVPSVCYAIAGNVVNRDDRNGGHQLGVVDADDNGMFTLNTADRHAVAFAQNTRDEVRLVNGDDAIAGALAASPGAKQQTYLCMSDDTSRAAVDEDMCGSLKVGGSAPSVSDGYTVRRLTPLECERLQGFPDGWTDLGGTPDAPRYKALGNSMAVPVMRWIGRRIDMMERSQQ